MWKMLGFVLKLNCIVVNRGVDLWTILGIGLDLDPCFVSRSGSRSVSIYNNGMQFWQIYFDKVREYILHT